MAPTLANPSRTSINGSAQVHMARSAFLVLGVLACFWGIWTSGREGLSQLLAGYGLMTDRIEEADRAVKLNPAIPEAHYVRASLLYNREELAEAIKEFERAVALRPRDYALWLELGRARDQANDVKGALAAFKESTRLAPFYAKPHWQLANTLFRAGRRHEAFAEFRRAITSNPQLLPQAMNLTWAAVGGDASAFEQALQPNTQTAHLALAGFLARHGKPTESIAHYRASGGVSNEQRRALLADLLASKSFGEAFEVWSSGPLRNGVGSPQGLAAFANGGFEEPITLDDSGFGWQLSSNLQAVRSSLDPAAPHAGIYSLRLDWTGESNPSTPVISQVVLIEPKTRYRLSFAVRTREMLTIGFPIVLVRDAGSDNENILTQSEAFPRGTSGWQNYLVEFTTSDMTRAIVIDIRREKCTVAPCAALGQIWVDDFSLMKL